MKKSSTRINVPMKAKKILIVDPSFAEEALAVPTVTYSIPETGKIIGISRSFAYQLVQRGEMPSIMFSKKAKRVLKADLLQYVRTHRTYLNNLN
jgi:excisionase family DNA binding protein